MMPERKRLHLDALPEELHLLILSFLDNEPPSLRQFWSEPSLKICREEQAIPPIKTLSLVSRSWRRLTLPSLLSCLQIHVDLGRARLRLANGRDDAYEQCLQDSIASARHLVRASSESEKTYSVTIIADSIINDGLNENGEAACITETIRLSFRKFVSQVFGWLDPTIVNIIAAPLDMALFTDTQLKDDAHQPILPPELAILHLRCDPSARSDLAETATAKTQDSVRPRGVLFMRRWSQVGFNVSCIPLPEEDYWADRPSLVGWALLMHLHGRYREISPAEIVQPFILSKLLICVNRCPNFTQHIHTIINLTERLELADTESVCYTASDGWNAVQTPHALSHRAQFIYSHLVRTVQGRRIVADVDGRTENRWTVANELMRLRQVVIHDVHSPDMAPTIDEIFTGLHLPVWAEYERGVYTRLLKLPAD